MEITDEEDQLIDTLAREVIGGEAPPALTERILSRAFPRRAGLRRWVAAGLAAAAVLTVSFLGWRFLGGSYPSPRVSRGQGQPAGESVQRGTVIRAEGGPATVTLGGYCRIELEPESALRIEGRDLAEEVMLLAGGVLCEVDRRVGSFVVRTEVGTVSVTGTKFAVRILEGRGEETMMGKQMFVRVLVGAVVLSGVWGLTPLQAGDETTVSQEPAATSTLSGTVVTACPKGMFIKIKTEKGEVVGFLPVVGETTQAAVKALKTGEGVKCTTTMCPKTNKLTVTKVEKLATP